MPAKKYIVELSDKEKSYLQRIIKTGKAAARKIQHAQILLKADSGPHGPAWIDKKIARAFSVRPRTVERIRKRLVEHGLEDALTRRRSPSGPRRRKLDGDAEARLIALTCSKPPKGQSRWTLQLLADKLVELRIVDSIGRETVRKTLKKTNLNRG